MLTAVLLALIGQAAAILASAAAWRQSRSANKAVNNRPGNDPTISDDVRIIRDKVDTIGSQLTSHLVWHEQRGVLRGQDQPQP